MIVPRQVQKSKLVALRGCFLFAQLEAKLLVKVDAGLWVRDADACVKEFDHAYF